MIGAGGREHALAWKLAQSRAITTDGGKLFATPGNPGIAHHAECFETDLTDHELVLAFCEQEHIGLVVVGPEAPLVDGLADSLRAEGFAVFGPSAKAAQLEGSKGFTKDLCARAGIPTAGYVRTTSLDQAKAALADFISSGELARHIRRMRELFMIGRALASTKHVVQAHLIPIRRCNLACTYCNEFDDVSKPVPIEELKRRVDELARPPRQPREPGIHFPRLRRPPDAQRGGPAGTGLRCAGFLHPAVSPSLEQKTANGT